MKRSSVDDTEKLYWDDEGKGHKSTNASYSIIRQMIYTLETNIKLHANYISI